MKYVLIVAVIAAALFLFKKFSPRIAKMFRSWANRFRNWIIQPALESVAAVRKEVESSTGKVKGAIGKIALEADAAEMITAGVLAKLPDAIDNEQQQKLDGLRAMVKRLRAERDNPWIPVVVRLHGLQINVGVASGREVHAQVLLNRKTGEVKAMPEGERAIEHEGSAYRKLPPASDLGSPRWARDPHDRLSIYMCGVVYTYRYGTYRHDYVKAAA